MNTYNNARTCMHGLHMEYGSAKKNGRYVKITVYGAAEAEKHIYIKRSRNA